MRSFRFFFVAFLVLELLLFGAATITRAIDPTIVYFPILPAIWLSMVIGGVHSAGLLSMAVAGTVTAFFYALVARGLVTVWRKQPFGNADKNLSS